MIQSTLRHVPIHLFRRDIAQRPPSLLHPLVAGDPILWSGHMKKALVTGSNGFIGHHLVKELLARGYSVNCLVRYTSDLALLRGLPVTLYIGDVREPETLAEPLKDAQYVFHLAAKLLVPTRQDFEETNTQGTINMLE